MLGDDHVELIDGMRVLRTRAREAGGIAFEKAGAACRRPAYACMQRADVTCMGVAAVVGVFGLVIVRIIVCSS